MTPSSTGNLNGLKPVRALSGEQIVKAVARVHENVENGRRDLAELYALAEGGTTLEHEIGECLTKIRAAAKRLREAIGELAQQELPLEG